MISHKVTTVNNKCRITFDFSPKNVVCSRGNYTATHVGGGTTSRKGIWEGVWLVEAWVKIGNNGWVNYGGQESVSVDVDDNNIEVQAEGLYSIKTMGYHFQCTDGSIPFFYYGNYGGKLNKYSYGYFTDGSPAKPKNNLHSIYAIVPKDWSYYDIAWTDWAYKHGKETNNWAYDNGRYEQRNGNYQSANSSNGWISDAGYKQISRKSVAFYFRKSYKDSVKTYGVVKDATNPQVTVYPAKGNKGSLSLKYVDRNNANGEIWLRAYCNGVQKDIRTYSNSGTFYPGQSWDYNIDFDAYFGREHEGHDVFYQAWARNSYGKESNGTGLIGGHRYNGRPTVPTGFKVKGENGLIYKKIIFEWDKASDPDGDTVCYDIWLRVKDVYGNTLQDGFIVNANGPTSFTYDISRDPEECKYEAWIRSSDCIIVSDWASSITFKKGAKPKGKLSMTSPKIDNTNLYCASPRFAFDGYDKKSNIIVSVNDVEFNSTKHPEYFTTEDNKVMFIMPDQFSSWEKVRIKAYMRNEYGDSEKSKDYTFYRKDISPSIINRESIIKAKDINQIREKIIDKGRAYNKHFAFDFIDARNTLITRSIFNEYSRALKEINNEINNIINNNKFDRQSRSPVINDINCPIDSNIWISLIEDIVII